MGKKTNKRQGGGTPYNAWRRQDKADRRKHSEHDNKKAQSIVAHTFKEEVVRMGVANALWLSLYEAGRATKRAADGSYYILGA